MRRILFPLCVLALLSISACSGYRTSDNGQTTVHAECVRLFGFAIPGDDQRMAADLAAQHIEGQPVTQAASPADWTSLFGIFGNIFGIHQTIMSGPAKAQ